ncbi:copper chaperone PCu(A)C [Plantibacter sp. YIM 135249]|uniref:copper chaperone PCu(A)C n=1 Tax=Plantibacter sp. YIM 135249 TaxID=3423918 RepID=UPI003D32E272
MNRTEPRSHEKDPSMNIVRFTASAVIAVAALALTACTPGAPDRAADGIAIDDAWVKASESDMTGGFATLANTSDNSITLTGAHSASSKKVELHETVADAAGAMMMRQKKGGFAIKPGDTLLLEPGGAHLMLIGLTQPIMPGDQLQFTLSFSDGSERDFTAPAKAFAGANENYDDSPALDAPNDGSAGHG